MYSYVPTMMYVYIPLPIDSPLPPPRPRRAAEIRPERGGGRTLPRQRFRSFSCRGRDLGRFPAAAEVYLFFLPRHRTFNTGSCYKPVLKGGRAKRCSSPTCATL